MEETKAEPTDAVEEKGGEKENETEEAVVPVRKKREMTPEYRKVLLERLEKARQTKQKGKKVGVKLKRTIKADPDEKQNFCSICRRSYASPYGLKVHCRKVHGEKKMSDKVKDAEAQQQEAEKPKEESKTDETKEEPKNEIIQPKNEVIKPTNQVITANVEEVTDKERLLIAKQKEAQARAKAVAIAKAQAPPKVKTPSEPRYTIQEYRTMEARHKQLMKSREKEMKAKAKQEHIQKSIQLMLAGGLR